MNARGFIALPLAAWLALGAAGVIAGLGIYGKVQSSRLDACKADFSAFQAKVEALGQVAAETAKKAESDNLQAKKRADNEIARTKRDLDGVYASYRSLRDQRDAGSGSVSQPPSVTSSSPRTCFDLATLNRGLADANEILQRGALEILERGDTAIVELNTARGWGQKLSYSIESLK